MKMTTKEFNKFLSDIGGLKSAYREGAIIDSRYFFSVGDGWLPLIKELIEDLIKLGWNKQVAQVKEKYGKLRFYIGEGSEEIWERIGKAEIKSGTICEVTGKPGSLREKNGWYKTLSNEMYLKWKNNEDIS